MAQHTRDEVAADPTARAAPSEHGGAERVEVHHKHHPIHVWPEFLKEVGIIVLGVLIALAAEQLVQSLEWRHKVQVAESAMVTEVGEDDGPEIYQRAVMHRCVQKRLEDIRAAVEGNASRRAVTELISSYRLQFLTFDSLARDAANASDVTVHMPHDRLQRWIDVYTMIPLMDRTNAKEAGDLAHLSAVRRTGGPLSDQERDRVLDSAETLREDDALMYAAVSYTLPVIQDMGIKLDPARMNRFMAWAKREYGDCIQPLTPGWWKSDQ